MEDNFIKIGEIIKSKRIENGYTQQDIANLLNVTKSAVSKWEEARSKSFRKYWISHRM